MCGNLVAKDILYNYNNSHSHYVGDNVQLVSRNHKISVVIIEQLAINCTLVIVVHYGTECTQKCPQGFWTPLAVPSNIVYYSGYKGVISDTVSETVM